MVCDLYISPQLKCNYIAIQLVAENEGRQIHERVQQRLEEETPRRFYDDGTPIGEFIWMDEEKFLSEHFGTLAEWNALVIYYSGLRRILYVVE